MENKSFDIEVFDFESGKHLINISGTEKPINKDEILTFDAVFQGIIFNDAEYEVKWVSEVINKKQIVLALYKLYTGKVFIPDSIKEKIEEFIPYLNEFQKIIKYGIAKNCHDERAVTLERAVRICTSLISK